MFKLGSLSPVSLFIEHFFEEAEFKIQKKTRQSGVRDGHSSVVFMLFLCEIVLGTLRLFFFFLNKGEVFSF